MPLLNFIGMNGRKIVNRKNDLGEHMARKHSKKKTSFSKRAAGGRVDFLGLNYAFTITFN